MADSSVPLCGAFIFGDCLGFSHDEKSAGPPATKKSGSRDFRTEWREGILESGKSTFNINSFNICIFK